MRTFLAVVSALTLASSAGAGSAGRRPQPYLLVALPSLGSVTWRCGATDAFFGLGYREFWASATTQVTLRANGRTVATKTVDPHELVSFPLLQAARQRLTFVQSTEPGTLRAVVTVDFRAHAPGYPPCRPYLPPRFAVAVYPRPSGR